MGKGPSPTARWSSSSRSPCRSFALSRCGERAKPRVRIEPHDAGTALAITRAFYGGGLDLASRPGAPKPGSEELSRPSRAIR